MLSKNGRDSLDSESQRVHTCACDGRSLRLIWLQLQLRLLRTDKMC